jgi:hypothetical protein
MQTEAVRMITVLNFLAAAAHCTPRALLGPFRRCRQPFPLGLFIRTKSLISTRRSVVRSSGAGPTAVSGRLARPDARASAACLSGWRAHVVRVPSVVRDILPKRPQAPPSALPPLARSPGNGPEV